jgi:hypothetical protein
VCGPVKASLVGSASTYERPALGHGGKVGSLALVATMAVARVEESKLRWASPLSACPCAFMIGYMSTVARVEEIART